MNVDTIGVAVQVMKHVCDIHLQSLIVLEHTVCSNSTRQQWRRLKDPLNWRGS